MTLTSSVSAWTNTKKSWPISSSWSIASSSVIGFMLNCFVFTITASSSSGRVATGSGACAHVAGDVLGTLAGAAARGSA